MSIKIFAWTYWLLSMKVSHSWAELGTSAVASRIWDTQRDAMRSTAVHTVHNMRHPKTPLGCRFCRNCTANAKESYNFSHLRRGWKSSDKVVWLIAIYRSVQYRSHCHWRCRWHCNCRQPGRAALMGLQATCCLPATGRGRGRFKASTCAHPATFQVFALVTCTDWASAAAAAAAGNRQQCHRKDIQRGH